ncbi:MAG: hypothetical protein N3C57_00215 [Aquificaceae bacterium]|nr:hypothetical protein [Aquificaceae bacterium]
MRKLFLLLSLLAGCGIKSNPKVLEYPVVDIKRIGERVYVKSLSGDIRIKGFERLGNYWIKDNPEGFCFLVERIGERSKNFCVEPSTSIVPSFELLEKDEKVIVLPSGFESYYLYPVKDNAIVVEEGKAFIDSVVIQRDYWQRCYAVAGISGSIQSKAVGLCVKPKPPPRVADVKSLEIREGSRSIYALWSYDEDYREFVVYVDYKEVGRTKGFAFELPKPEKKVVISVKVINPMGFESEGYFVDYSP